MAKPVLQAAGDAEWSVESSLVTLLKAARLRKKKAWSLKPSLT
jgi:hypothetical protein